MSQRYIGGLIYNPPGGFSGYYDGSGDNLTIASNAAFQFGSGAFTIEAWVFPTSYSSSFIISQKYVFGDVANSEWLFFVTTSAELGVALDGGGGEDYIRSATNTVPLNTWSHCAVTKSGSTVRLFLNGVQVQSGTSSRTLNSTSTSVLVGASGTAGYLSNVRILKGTALYTSNFDPPTGQLQAITNTSLLTCAYPTFRDGSSNNFTITVNGNTAVSTQNPFPQTQLPNPALGNQGNGVYSMSQYQALRSQNLWPAIDPYFDYVTLMLHGNGTNGAQNNTFLDSSTNNFTITRNGNTTQGTFTPYGSNWSNYTAGSPSGASRVDVSGASGIFGTNISYTMEGWFLFTTNSAGDAPNFITINTNTFPSRWLWDADITGGNLTMRLYTESNAVVFNSTATPYALGTWVHLAVVNNNAANTCTFYMNGVAIGSRAKVSLTAASTLNLLCNSTSVSSAIPFYVSNFRIVNNVALYTSNFTPSTSPLTAVSGTALLAFQSNRFIDTSGSNLTLTPNGTNQIQRFSPFAPTTPYAAGTIGGSGYFDGSGDYLVCGTAADWAFMSNSTALWSVEMWVYPTTLGSDTTLLDTAQSTTANVGMAMQINANRTVQVEIYRGSAGTYVVTGDSTSTLVANQWNHILATYDQSLASQNLKFYINGGSAETTNKTGNAPSASNPNRAMTIATYGAGGGQFFTGYIGSMRISNVIRSSGVPTAPYTSDANTVLLTNYTNGGIIDNAMMNDLETVGNAQISTSVSKFGGGSLAFDGSGDWLQVPMTPQTQLKSASFTVEFWLYPNALQDANPFTWGTNDSYFGTRVIINAGGTWSLLMSTTGSSHSVNSGAVGSYVANSWFHVAVVRNGTAVAFYINGVSIYSTTLSGALIDGLYNRIGALTHPSSPFALNGYIDDLRITNGYARYTANFTPQRSQWQDQ